MSDNKTKDFGKCNICTKFFEKSSITHKTHAGCLDDMRNNHDKLKRENQYLYQDMCEIIKFLPDNLQFLFKLGVRVGRLEQELGYTMTKE